MARQGWIGRVLLTSALGLVALGGCSPWASDQAAKRPNEDGGPIAPPDPSTTGPTNPSGATGTATDGTRR